MNAFRISTFKQKALAGSMVMFLLSQGLSAQGQSAADTQTIQLYIVAGMLIFVCVAVLITAIYTLQVMQFLLLKDAPETTEATESLWSRIYKRFIAGDMTPVDPEKEKAIALSHSYDGIVELDNYMPPWLKYIFYGTIAFAVIYLVNFFSLGLVQTSEQEYVAEVQQAEVQIAQYRKANAASIDENTAKVVKEEALLAQAKTIYEQNCKACHGGDGEGGVGPNLTDEYWLHGGDVKEVFKTIKYGIPQKGMIAWQQKLKPDEIQSVASYILSLQGTKPANAKEPQGEKVTSVKNTTGPATLSLTD
jgi:cytochrome c oxidase cbb3-type subunit III